MMNITAIMEAAIIRSGKKEQPIEVCSVFVFGNSFQPHVLMYEELQRQRYCGNHLGLWKGLSGPLSLILSPVSALSVLSHLCKSHPAVCFFNDALANKQLIGCPTDAC